MFVTSLQSLSRSAGRADQPPLPRGLHLLKHRFGLLPAVLNVRNISLPLLPLSVLCAPSLSVRSEMHWVPFIFSADSERTADSVDPS